MDKYALFASLYDPIVSPFLRPIHEAMLHAMTARHCRTVLDLCCGTGFMVGMASNAGINPVGIDLSPAMLDIAHTKQPNTDFILGDASAISFSDNTFDATTISFALHEKPVKTARAMLNEAKRVTKSGGLILVADYRIPMHRQSRFTKWSISLIEKLAGTDHHTHFRAYMAAGGSASFLTESGLTGQPSATFMGGWAGMFLSTNT